MSFLITNITPNASDEAEQLRVVAAFQSTVRGASPTVLLKLGTQRLADLTAAILKEQTAVTDQAQKFKADTNSSLSVDALVALGPAKLAELSAKAAGRHVDQHDGYSLNSFLDEPKA